MFFLSVLAVLQLVWVAYFVAVNIAGYAVAGVSQSSRQDLIGLGTHFITVITVVHFAAASPTQSSAAEALKWRVAPLIFAFECVRDTFNAIDMTWYTTLLTETANGGGGLAVAAIVLSWYQLALSVVALFFFLLFRPEKGPSSSVNDYDAEKTGQHQRRRWKPAYNAA
jgi:hypothetical protein